MQATCSWFKRKTLCKSSLKNFWVCIMSLILLFFQTRLAIKKIRCVVVEVLLFSIIYTLALFSRCSSQLSHKYVIHAGKRKLFSTLLFRLQLVVCVAKLNSKHNPSSIIKIVSQWRPFSFILYNLYDKQFCVWSVNV